MSESPDTASRISLVASSNYPSSGSLYHLFTRSSYFIIASSWAGEYGIVTFTLIGIQDQGKEVIIKDGRRLKFSEYSPENPFQAIYEK